MNKEHINSKETSHQEFIVETRQVDGNLWIITKREKSDLFNVSVGRTGNNLCAIFRSDVLREESATRSYLFEWNGKLCETMIYDLETLMRMSYRIALLEAGAFRQWVMKALCNGSRDDKNSCAGEVLITYNHDKNPPLIVALN